MNWLDVGIGSAVLAGIALGAHRGILRQVALIAAFYASLVLAARYYGQAAGLVVSHLPSADRSVASAYVLAGITLSGTLALSWLSHGVYSATALPYLGAIDRLAGAGLGAAWSWAVVAFAVTVLLYGVSFSWGPHELLRRDLGDQIERSQLIGLVRATMPRLRELLQPWLPGGLPAPLSA